LNRSLIFGHSQGEPQFSGFEDGHGGGTRRYRVADLVRFDADDKIMTRAWGTDEETPHELAQALARFFASMFCK
jgi:hypothetical protein